MRISEDNYKKINKSVQDRIIESDARELLADYELVENIEDIKRGDDIKYISIKKVHGRDKHLFRFGGNVRFVDPEKKYFVLTTGRLSWSVQFNDKNIIYKKSSIDDIADKFTSRIQELEQENERLRAKNNKYKSDLVEIKKLIRRFAPTGQPGSSQPH